MTMLRQFDVQRQRLAAISRCRAIVALSEHVVREYAQHGIAADRLHVLPPVVRDVAPATRGQPPDPPHVVYVGRLERLKGPGVLMDALGPAADRLGSRLVATFAGEGSYAQALAAKAREVRRQWPAVDVRLVGKLPTDAVDALFAGASLVGVPSLWPEPFGLVGLEAGCFGVPAVAFRSGGIPEWLKDGTNGRLAVVHGSAASLADAIASVLSDSEGYLRLRAGARAEAQRATRNTHLAQLEAVLRDAAVAPHESPRLAPSAPDERF